MGGSQKATCFWPKRGTIQWQKGYRSTRIEKKGTPLRFRAKKGQENKILEKYFRMLNLGGSQKAICFRQKRVQFNGKKGHSSTRIEKKSTPLGLGPHTAVNVCRAELKMRRISFFGPNP